MEARGAPTRSGGGAMDLGALSRGRRRDGDCDEIMDDETEPVAAGAAPSVAWQGAVAASAGVATRHSSRFCHRGVPIVHRMVRKSRKAFVAAARTGWRAL